MNSLKAISITTFFGRIFEFAAGVIMALSVLRNKTYKFATMTGLFFFISTFSAQAFINYQFQKFAIQTIGGFVINSIVISFSVAMFIYGIMKENTIFSRMLSTRLMVLLGKSSYTLYLLHWSMTGYLIRRFISSNFIVEILITYVFSIFLWHLIEEPCNKFIKKFRILQPERNSL